MENGLFVLILQLFFIGLWLAPLIVPYLILKHWAEEKRNNDSGGGRIIKNSGKLNPTKT